MAKPNSADEWHILSDNELVQRARRLTIVGLLIALGFLGLAGWMFRSSPVQEQGGPARAVHIPYNSSTSKGSTPPPAQSVDTASVAPNPWIPKPTAQQPPPPPPPADGKVYDM